jgi:ribosomal protein L29
MPKTKNQTPAITLDESKIKLASIKLNIRAGIEKNTNAHKKLKKQIAQLLTKNQQPITKN